jgi:hypothetical protein
MPEAPARDPISTDACAPIATPVARSLRSFRLDSQRQIARIARASESLNGTLASSDAEALVNRFQWTKAVDELPREIVIELNTNRRSSPIYWPGRHLKIERNAPADDRDLDQAARRSVGSGRSASDDRRRGRSIGMRDALPAD